MTLSITFAIVPLLCFNCTVNEMNSNITEFVDLNHVLEPLQNLIPGLLDLVPSDAVAGVPPPPPGVPAAAEPLLGLSPVPASTDLPVAPAYPELAVPPAGRQLPSGIKPLSPYSFIIPLHALSLRQDAPVDRPFLSAVSAMIDRIFPQYYQQPEQAREPAEVAPTHKGQDHEKAAHADHEHLNEPAHSLPTGVVADGHFYQGQKANGEYFNDETQESPVLEVHSHDELTSGKLYDNKSEHPYYVVDKPAEGPAPPPITYFTSGLRSEDSTAAASEASAAAASAAAAAAWDNYYAKLREFHNYYYGNVSRRSSRNKADDTSKEADGSVQAETTKSVEAETTKAKA